MVKAELSCNIPYDIDDNPDDDTAQTFYKPTDTNPLEDSNLVIGILTAIVVIILAYFVGLISNKKPTKENQESRKPQNKLILFKR